MYSRLQIYEDFLKNEPFYFQNIGLLSVQKGTQIMHARFQYGFE